MNHHTYIASYACACVKYRLRRRRVLLYQRVGWGVRGNILRFIAMIDLYFLLRWFVMWAKSF